jgi:NAD(P)H-dependent FMN reductase
MQKNSIDWVSRPEFKTNNRMLIGKKFASVSGGGFNKGRRSQAALRALLEGIGMKQLAHSEIAINFFDGSPHFKVGPSGESVLVDEAVASQITTVLHEVKTALMPQAAQLHDHDPSQAELARAAIAKLAMEALSEGQAQQMAEAAA